MAARCCERQVAVGVCAASGRTPQIHVSDIVVALFSFLCTAKEEHASFLLTPDYSLDICFV